MSDLGLTLHLDTDLSPQMQTVSGRVALIQALMRRLATSPGGLWYDLEYGTNLCDFVNSGSTTYEIGRAAELECDKDERVETVTATAEILESSARLSIDIVSGDDEFTLVLDVTKLSVDLLEIREAA